MNTYLTEFLAFWIRSLPSVTIISLLLVDLFVLAGNYPAPQLGIIALIYWSIYRPDLLNIVAVIILGILMDVMKSQSAWVYSFIFLLVNLIATSQCKFFYRKPFHLIWGGVGVIVFFYYLLVIGYLAGFMHGKLEFGLLCSSFLLTLCCIPLVFRAMLYCHKLLHERI
jgi:rod shape-determining protein MreD